MITGICSCGGLDCFGVFLQSTFSTAPRSETTETPLQVAAFPPLIPPLNFVFCRRIGKKVVDAQLKLSGSSHSSLLPPPPSSSSLAFATTAQDPAAQQREPARHQEHRTSSPRMYGGTSQPALAHHLPLCCAPLPRVTPSCHRCMAYTANIYMLSQFPIEGNFR